MAIIPNCVILYMCLSKLHLLNSMDTKARSILEKAREKFPNEGSVWIESIRLEIICGNKKKGANYRISNALQKNPANGKIWVLAIELEEKYSRKAKALDALNKCEHDPYVMLAIAKIFIQEKMYEKARKWFERATKINSDIGDIWAYYYKMELDLGLTDKALEIMDKCCKSNPRHGELWCSVSKQVGNWRLKTKEIIVKVAEKIIFEYN